MSLAPVEVSWPADRRPAQLHLLGGSAATSIATAVSADGSTPVGIARVDGGREQAVRWRDGVRTPLAVPKAYADHHVWANATSRNGDVVVGVAIGDGNASTALVWRHDAIGAGLVPPDGIASTVANAVSRDGALIAGCADGCSSVVKWTGDSWQLIPVPSRFFPAAHLMSEDGATLAGTIEGDTSSEGLRLGPTNLRLGKATQVEGVSDDGAILVGRSGRRAALWRGKKLTDLGILRGYETCEAAAVSSDGGRVVGTCHREHAERPTVAFIWDKKRGIRTVHEALAAEHKVAVPESTWLSEANDICAYGLTVVGSARTKTSTEEAWMAIVPR